MGRDGRVAAAQCRGVAGRPGRRRAVARGGFLAAKMAMPITMAIPRFDPKLQANDTAAKMASPHCYAYAKI